MGTLAPVGFWEVSKSQRHKASTLGLLQGWRGIVAMVILSLLVFIWSEQTSLGFCLLTCTFISLTCRQAGRSAAVPGRTSNEFQPCPLGVSRTNLETQ